MKTSVVSVETANKLLAANFPQDTDYYWEEVWLEHKFIRHRLVHRVRENLGQTEPNPAAPGPQEIANQLPNGFDGEEELGSVEELVITHLLDGCWRARLGKVVGLEADTIAEALASLWFKLRELMEDRRATDDSLR